MPDPEAQPPDVEVRVLRAPAITPEEHTAIFEVFDASYRQANHEYLQRSIDRIGLLALGTIEGRAVAYAISHTRWMDLPGFDEPQLVALHGMRCVLPEYRHRGVNGRLTGALEAAMKSELEVIGRKHARQLSCGRHGHASRTGTAPAAATSNQRTVPLPGQPPTPWQQAVGLAVADAYGSTLDPETFVCVGSGTPIGYPNEEFEPTEAERQVYAPVDRDRGDNLLVITWSPDAPPGWDDPDHRSS